MSDIDSLLPTVDDSTLDTDELHDVMRALEDCKADWEDIGTALHIKVGKLEEIKRAHPSDPNRCMRATMTEWLKKNYKTEKYGDPSWRILVKAVGDVNKDVARKIAQANPAPGVAQPPVASKQVTSTPVVKHSKVLDEKPTSSTLTLIKWRKGGEIRRLRIIDTICNEWQTIGNTLGIPSSNLQRWWKEAHNNDTQTCCNSIFRYWLQNPPKGYPLSWHGIIELLNDTNFETLAEELVEALENRV